MSNPVYIILEVEYSKHPELQYGHSLGWVAPALKDAEVDTYPTGDGSLGLYMTEDSTDDCTVSEDDEGNVTAIEWHMTEDEWPHRKWAGIVDAETFERFSCDLCLDEIEPEPSLGMLTEYGHLADRRYHFSGMDWNVGGMTPVEYVSLSVSVPADSEEETR